MTTQKHFKQLVRTRMRKTGETYTTARRHLLHTGHQPKQPTLGAAHLAGNIPATTALRVLLAHAGVRDANKKPLSEAMVFGMAGGIGIGVFQFYYEKEDFATFFLGGRHSWHDDLAYNKTFLKDVGLETLVHETTGAKTAEKQLRSALSNGAPCIVWVDAGHLPNRAMPDGGYGSSYHVVTAYGIDDAKNDIWVGDCSDQPISISMEVFKAARARIKKQKNRVLALAPGAGDQVELDDKEISRLMQSGLQRCSAALHTPAMQWAKANFKLGALDAWSKRLHGSDKKDSWSNVFKPGPNLWRGLTCLHDTVEHYGTGGGLCRTIMADFLAEASKVTGDSRLSNLADEYRSLGQAWSELAHAALPEEIPMLRDVRVLLAKKAELISAGAPAVEVKAIWDQLTMLDSKAAESFPMRDAECDDLRARLKERVVAIHAAEVSALAALDSIIG